MRLFTWIFSGALAFTGAARLSAQPAGETAEAWTSTSGTRVEASLRAEDGHHCVLQLAADGRKINVPLSSLAEADRSRVREWRDSHPDAPWIDPEAMAPWPRESSPGEVKIVPVTEGIPDNQHVYLSEHFEIHSEVKLPPGTVETIAETFEATYTAIHDLPLGLGAVPLPIQRMRENMGRNRGRFAFSGPGLASPADGERMLVELYATPESYARAGGAAGSGGYYATWLGKTLLSLPNLGVKEQDGWLNVDLRKNLFVLKHEISHQILSAWMPLFPEWIDEGFAEYLAAAGYSRGHYSFDRMPSRLHEYVNRWRFNEPPNDLPVMSASRILTLSEKEWMAELRARTPILHYNSAALFVFHFLHDDRKGDAAHFAAYLDALRRGIPSDQAQETHLLRGRTPEELDAELKKTWETRGVRLVFDVFATLH